MLADIEPAICDGPIHDGILVDACYDLDGTEAYLMTIAIWCGVPRS